jgi:hypothetical protein
MGENNKSSLDNPNSQVHDNKNALDDERHPKDEFPTSVLRPQPIRLGSMSLFDLIGRGYSLNRPLEEEMIITPEPQDAMSEPSPVSNEKNDDGFRTEKGSGSILFSSHCKNDVYAESLRKVGALHPEPKEEEEIYDWNDEFSTLSSQVEELLATTMTKSVHPQQQQQQQQHLITMEQPPQTILRPKALRPVDFAFGGERTLPSLGSYYFYPL